MNRLSPLVWISLGLVSLTLTAMLAGDVVFQLVRDETPLALQYRRALSESLAVQYSSLAGHGEFAVIEQAMAFLVARNEDILSAAIRGTDGTVLATAGGHEQHWQQPPGDSSTFDHIQVPIYAGDRPHSMLQITFRAVHETGRWTWITNPWIQFLAFVAAVTFLGFLLFMKRTLRHLDPSAVVPARVKTALDALTEGVALLNTQGEIVLANQALAKRLGAEPDGLAGRPLAAFPWTCVQPPTLVTTHPWTVTLKTSTPQVGARWNLALPDGSPVRYIVNSVPILEEHGRLRGTLVSLKDVTELECTNDSLKIEMAERQQAERQREDFHRQLQAASRRAGMADVASSMLHNVGNVLNSVNVSANTLTAKLRSSPVHNLARVADMLKEHAHGLAEFLDTDPDGKQIPSYLAQLATFLEQERDGALQEIEALNVKIEHIKQIVTAQQLIPKSQGIRESVNPIDLANQALMMCAPSLGQERVKVVQHYEDVPPIETDPHQVLQILVNLITNAVQAMSPVSDRERRLTLEVRMPRDTPGRVVYRVGDTGVGIRAEHYSQLFSQGFTTKPNGNGLGLHSGAIAAKILGGGLSAESMGAGAGATFTLELPVAQAAVRAAA